MTDQKPLDTENDVETTPDAPPAAPPEELEAADPDTADPAAAEIDRVIAELEESRDQYLRLAADFDNFRKRIVRERAENRNRAQAEVISTLLEAIDDLDRVAHLDPAQAKVSDVLEGVALVERKMMRELGTTGLERLGAVGEVFDPNLHEAIGGQPAVTADQDQTIAQVLQVGYRLGAQLIRPARVQVFMYAGEPQDADG